MREAFWASLAGQFIAGESRVLEIKIAVVASPAMRAPEAGTRREVKESIARKLDRVLRELPEGHRFSCVVGHRWLSAEDMPRDERG